MIKKHFNLNKGELIKVERWPNVFTYGLTQTENDILQKSLPHNSVTVTDITDCASDIVTKTDFALIINPHNISDEELGLFVSFYDGIDGCTESVIFTQKCTGIQELFKDVKTVVFNDTAELEHNLKYELLQAFQKTNKADNFSNSLSQAITILFAIRNNPYITTKELSLKIERTPRTVQRYIETLRCAGEWIEYDSKKKGWYLFDNKSILLDEI